MNKQAHQLPSQASVTYNWHSVLSHTPSATCQFTYGKKRNSVTVPAHANVSFISSSVTVSLNSCESIPFRRI